MITIGESNINDFYFDITSNLNYDITSLLGGNVNIKDVKTTTNSTLILTNDCNVYGWGSNQYGELGLGNITPITELTHITSNITKIDCGQNHSLFLDLDGVVHSCGKNSFGQLGLNNNTVINTLSNINLDNIEDISAGDNLSLFKKTNGEIYWCGKLKYQVSEISDGGYNEEIENIPKFIASNVKKILADNDFIYYVTNYNDIYKNNDLILGNSTFTDININDHKLYILNDIKKLNDVDTTTFVPIIPQIDIQPQPIAGTTDYKTLTFTYDTKYPKIDDDSTNLILQWKFDDADNLNYDSVSETNKGTLSSGVLSTTGQIETAIDFHKDGKNLSYDIPTSLINFQNTSHSFTFWFNLNSAENRYGRLIELYNASFQILGAAATGKGRVRLAYAFSASLDNDDIIDLNQWYHFAVIVDIVTLDFKLYKNGVSVSIADFDVSITNTAELRQRITFGKMYGSITTRDADGQIDDFRIYNKALSIDEITDLYNQYSQTSYTLTFDNPTESDILIVGNTNASQYNTIELSGNIPINVGSNSSVGSYNTSSGSKPITSSITGISITYYDPIVIIRYKTKMFNTTSYNETYNKITKGFDNLFFKSLDNNIYTLNPITTTNTNYGTTTSELSFNKLNFFTDKIVDNIFSSKHKDSTLFITSNNLIYNSGDLIYNNLVSKNTVNEPKLINDIFDTDLINIIRYKNDDGYYLRYSDKVLDDDKNQLTFSNIDSNNIKKIEKTINSTVILTKEGTVYIKGDLNGITYNETVEVIPEEIIIDISCGNEHVLFRTANKSLYVLGNNFNGQLGTGNNTNINNTPENININSEVIEDIICGYYNSIIKTNSNKYYICGIHNNSNTFTEYTSLPSSIKKIIARNYILIFDGNTIVGKKEDGSDIEISDIEDVYVNNSNVFFKKTNGDIINENDDILYSHNDSLTINKGIIDGSDNLLLSYKNNDVEIDPDIEYQKEWIYTNDATYYMGNVAIGKTTATDKLDISGTLSTNYGKQFKITHPLDSNLWLYHSSIECPRNDNIYRGEAIIKNGYVEVNIDKECNTTGGMIEGTFKKLNKNTQLFLQNNDTFDNVKGNINNNIIKIYCENKNKDIKVNWIVIGERDDEEIKKLEITDINGCLVCEHLLS